MARGHHALSVEMFSREADRWLQVYATARNASRKLYARRQLENCRKREMWHRERAQLGVVDPPEIAVLVAVAEERLEALNHAAANAPHTELRRQFKAAVRAAGHALRAHWEKQHASDGAAEQDDLHRSRENSDASASVEVP